MATRNIVSVRNLKWDDLEETMLYMEVNFAEEPEEFVPFTPHEDDVEEYSRVLYQAAMNGDYGPIASFEPPEDVTGEEALSLLREERTLRLEETDYIEMPTKWSTLSAEQQEQWTAYRNALRDMPSNNSNAELRWDSETGEHAWSNVEWPTRPN